MSKVKELGKCQVGDIIVGNVFKAKLIVRKVTYDHNLWANMYLCEFLESHRKGETIEIYEFYDYSKVQQ